MQIYNKASKRRKWSILSFWTLFHKHKNPILWKIEEIQRAILSISTIRLYIYIYKIQKENERVSIQMIVCWWMFKVRGSTVRITTVCGYSGTFLKTTDSSLNCQLYFSQVNIYILLIYLWLAVSLKNYPFLSCLKTSLARLQKWNGCHGLLTLRVRALQT